MCQRAPLGQTLHVCSHLIWPLMPWVRFPLPMLQMEIPSQNYAETYLVCRDLVGTSEASARPVYPHALTLTRSSEQHFLLRSCLSYPSCPARKTPLMCWAGPEVGDGDNSDNCHRC